MYFYEEHQYVLWHFDSTYFILLNSIWLCCFNQQHHQATDNKLFPFCFSHLPDKNSLQHTIQTIFTWSIQQISCADSLITCAAFRIENWIDWHHFHHHSSNKSLSWWGKPAPAPNLDDIPWIYSLNQLCCLSYHLCYTQNWKLNRLTPFSWSVIEQKCQLVGKTTSSIEFRRYSGDLFNRELVLIVSTVVRYVKSKTESIDAVSNGYHRWKSLSLFCVDIIVLYGASKLVFVLFVVLQFFFLFFLTGFYFCFSGLK